MKRISFLVLAVALLGASCNRQPAAPEHRNNYSNLEYGFSFNYPDAYSPIPSPSYGNLAGLVQVQTVQDPQPGTNLSDLAFTVSAKPNQSMQECTGPNA